MLLREKGKKDAKPVGFGWDEAQAALQAGTHEVVTPPPAEEGAKQAGESEPDDGLDDKTKAELEAIAKDRGVDVSAAKTKADVLAALRAAR